MNSLKLAAVPLLFAATTACGDLRISSTSALNAAPARASAGGESSTGGTALSLAAPATFRAAGHSYYQSTGCSPHSTSLDIKVSDETLSVKYSEMIGSFALYVMQLPSPHTIEATVQPARYGLPDDATAQALSPDSSAQATAYGAALAAIRQGVDKMREGNACFPGRPELAEVSDYLNQF